MILTVLEVLTPAIHCDDAFVCYGCCHEGTAYEEDGCTIFDCPVHMKLWFQGPRVIRVERHGVRH